jgi:hypothetical protein
MTCKNYRLGYLPTVAGPEPNDDTPVQVEVWVVAVSSRWDEYRGAVVMETMLAKLTAVEQALAQAQTILEVKTIRD